VSEFRHRRQRYRPPVVADDRRAGLACACAITGFSSVAVDAVRARTPERRGHNFHCSSRRSLCCRHRTAPHRTARHHRTHRLLPGCRRQFPRRRFRPLAGIAAAGAGITFSSQYSAPSQKTPLSGTQPACRAGIPLPERTLLYRYRIANHRMRYCRERCRSRPHLHCTRRGAGHPSSQTTGTPARHAPAPSQVSSPLQNTLSGQGLAAASNVQVALQQSPSDALPSSHCSSPHRTPSPQVQMTTVAGIDPSLHTYPSPQDRRCWHMHHHFHRKTLHRRRTNHCQDSQPECRADSRATDRRSHCRCSTAHRTVHIVRDIVTAVRRSLQASVCRRRRRRT